MHVLSLSVVSDSATPWTVAHQAPPSMGFSRQEYWNGVPFPSPGDHPDPEIEPWQQHLRLKLKLQMATKCLEKLLNSNKGYRSWNGYKMWGFFWATKLEQLFEMRSQCWGRNSEDSRLLQLVRWGWGRNLAKLGAFYFLSFDSVILFTAVIWNGM